MDFILLGKRIRDERLLLRMTIEDLAEKTDKSSNFIGQIERGERKPSVETLADIANALGTTVDSLMSDNVHIKESDTINKINNYLYSFGEHEKKFILEFIKKYKDFHS